MKKTTVLVLCAAVAACAFVPFAANAATTHRAWSGAAGDYTDPTMWVDGIVSGLGECADLSTTDQGAGIAYIRDGMNITNGWINCGRTNDFTIIMTGGYVQLTQSEKVSDAALKISRGEDVSGGDPLRPDGTMTISGGFFNVTNGCVSVGERGYGVLTMTGGELWAKGRLSIAYLAGSSGKMTVSGGAKASAASFNLVRPAATLIVDGGTLAQSKKLTVTPFANNFIWGDTGASGRRALPATQPLQSCKSC